MTSGDTTPTSLEGQPYARQWRRLQSLFGPGSEGLVPPNPRSAGGRTAKSLTYYEAALQTLRSAGRPLTTREITDLAIAKGLIVPTGKTPHASMGRVLYLRVRDDPELVKMEQQSRTARARRGSVRWILLPNSAD